jgi:hypothetical protein
VCRGSPFRLRIAGSCCRRVTSRDDSTSLRILSVATRGVLDGVVSVSPGFGAPMAGLGSSSSRPFCDAFLPPSSPLRLASGGSEGVDGGCSVLLVEGSRLLHVSASGMVTQGTPKGQIGSASADSGSSVLARAPVIPSLVGAVQGPTLAAHSGSGRSSTAVFLGRSRQHGDASTSRMASVRHFLRSSGVSQGTASLSADAHRQSSRSVYDNHGRRWSFWCRKRRVDPFSPTEADLVNRLAQIFSGPFLL